MVFMAGAALRQLGSSPFFVRVNTALQSSCESLYGNGIERPLFPGVPSCVTRGSFPTGILRGL